MPKPLRTGHARREITPPLGIPMGGYAARGSRGCQVIEEPLGADALFLEQGAVRVVLVAADLVSIDEAWGMPVRQAIAERLGMTPAHVVLLASHTHFGPATLLDEITDARHAEWLRATQQALIEVAEAAASAARVSTLRAGSRDVSPVMYNRRLRRPDGTCCTVYRLPLPEPDLTFGPVDPKLSVLRFDGSAGQPVALLASVGIHPVVGGGDFYGISPDYPGVLRRVLEAAYGVPALFALGTAGNVVPIARGEGQRERIGRFLAGAALQAAETAEDVPVRLSVAHRRLALPAAPRLEAGAMADALAAAREQVQRYEAAGDARALTRAREHLRRLEAVARAAERFGLGDTIPFEMTAIGLGELGLLCLPGEIFAETGLHLQARSPFPRTLVLSLANQATGYLPTRTAFWQGGYEVSVTLMAEESEAAAVAAANDLLLQAWEQGLTSG